MKLAPFFTVLSSTDAAGKFLSRDEASQFLSRTGRANTENGLEEYRAANMERECNEEVCDFDEAFEILEDKAKTDEFMYNRLHQCELKTPCFASGTQSCVNKWNNYWCECIEGWYGKDCDYIDTQDGYVCQDPNGCSNPLPGAAVKQEDSQAIIENLVVETTASSKGPRPEPAKVQVSPYSAAVFCDVENNSMRVELPEYALGEMKMGLDVYSAICGATARSERGVIYSYKFDECGTRMQTDDQGDFVYENHIGRGPLMVNGVYRDLGISYNVRCIIDRHGHVDNRFVNETTGETGGEIIPIYSMPENLQLSGSAEDHGNYLFRLNVYETELYKQKYQISAFPLTMAFKEYVYLGVEVLTAMKHQYIFTERCWATPNADPQSRSAVFYPIMDTGCPSDEFTELEPRYDLEDRFKTETLKFPDSSYVYIQCDVIVCDLNVPNDPACQSTCRQPVGPKQTNVARTDDELKGIRRRRDVSTHPRQLVTVGPIQVRKSNPTAVASSASYAGWIVAGLAVVGLVGFAGYQHKKENQVEPQIM